MRPVDLLLVRPSDIPEYAQDGVVDVGITGANLVAEADAEVVTLAELGFARCSLDAAVPVDAAHSAIDDLDGLRVATAYPVSTRRLLAERGVECELIPVSGSVEATPRLGLADAIVDLVSTGSTMSANGLRPIGTLLTSQAVLVGGRAAIEARREAVEQLELMLSGVVAGRRRRYVMMNAHVDDLPAIRAVCPGWARRPCSNSRTTARSRCTPRSRSTRSGTCSRCSAGGSDIDPRPPDRAAGGVRRSFDEALATVAPIVADVRERGDDALLEWTSRLDGPRPDGIECPPNASTLRGSTTTSWTHCGG
jgi:ATP phosphoribosyltransferase